VFAKKKFAPIPVVFPASVSAELFLHRLRPLWATFMAGSTPPTTFAMIFNSGSTNQITRKSGYPSQENEKKT
jgi:hypothetical protein